MSLRTKRITSIIVLAVMLCILATSVFAADADMEEESYQSYHSNVSVHNTTYNAICTQTIGINTSKVLSKLVVKSYTGPVEHHMAYVNCHVYAYSLGGYKQDIATYSDFNGSSTANITIEKTYTNHYSYKTLYNESYATFANITLPTLVMSIENQT